MKKKVGKYFENIIPIVSVLVFKLWSTRQMLAVLKSWELSFSQVAVLEHWAGVFLVFFSRLCCSRKFARLVCMHRKKQQPRWWEWL
jgi:hypothetical protein